MSTIVEHDNRARAIVAREKKKDVSVKRKNVQKRKYVQCKRKCIRRFVRHAFSAVDRHSIVSFNQVDASLQENN